MKNGKSLLAVLLVLFIASLACSSSEVEVNQPSDQGAQPVQNGEATTAPLGTTRSNPAPAGSEVVVDDMGFVVTGSTRPATDIVMAGNQFNTAPESGQEYIIINVRITCKKSADEKCSFFSYSLKALGSSGVERDPEIIVAGVEGLYDFSSSEFYGGASVEGGIPFIINADETDLLLVYSPIFGNPFYLAIQ